jgi:hypothetical protein
MSQILYLVTHLQSLLLFRAQIYQNLGSPKPTNEINHGAQL